MRTFLLATVSTLALTSAVSAADLMGVVVEDDVIITAASEVDWSGFYAGLHAGYGWFTGLVDNDTGSAIDDFDSITTEGSGFLLGAQAGFNMQSGNFVYGIEGDIAWVGFDEAYGYDGGDNYTSAAISGMASLRGRLGVTAGSALLFASAGIVGVMADQCATDDDDLGNDPVNLTCADATYDAVRSDEIQVGGIVGAGIEVMVSEGISLKADYSYFQTSPITQEYFEGAGEADFSTSGHIVRFGFNAHM